jgi:hypothetical protein
MFFLQGNPASTHSKITGSFGGGGSPLVLPFLHYRTNHHYRRRHPTLRHAVWGGSGGIVGILIHFIPCLQEAAA